MGFFSEFREFAVRGNVTDMAVGIIVGTAFTGLVQSFVKNVFMPPVSILTGDFDFENRFLVIREGTPPPPYATVEAAQAAGAVTVNYGLFLNAFISLVIVAFVAFMMIRTVNKLHRERKNPNTPPVDPATRTCPFCVTEIPRKATRCPSCTSEVEPMATAA